MFTVNGLPLHPLVIHAVVVLLPLATLGAVLIAARPAWRRAFGVPVLLIALVGVIAVPIATNSGEQLQRALGGGSPLIEVHEERADNLLPWAVLFLVALAVTVVAGIRADRAAAGGTTGDTAGDGAGGTVTATRTLSRVTVVAGVLAALLGLVVTGLVIWIGDAGATATWSGTVS